MPAVQQRNKVAKNSTKKSFEFRPRKRGNRAREKYAAKGYGTIVAGGGKIQFVGTFKGVPKIRAVSKSPLPEKASGDLPKDPPISKRTLKCIGASLASVSAGKRGVRVDLNELAAMKV